MEAAGAGNAMGCSEVQSMSGDGDDGVRKVIPPCCLKAMGPCPSEAKCHETVVSGWFSEGRSWAIILSFILNIFISQRSFYMLFFFGLVAFTDHAYLCLLFLQISPIITTPCGQVCIFVAACDSVCLRIVLSEQFFIFFFCILDIKKDF